MNGFIATAGRATRSHTLYVISKPFVSNLAKQAVGLGAIRVRAVCNKRGTSLHKSFTAS